MAPSLGAWACFSKLAPMVLLLSLAAGWSGARASVVMSLAGDELDDRFGFSVSDAGDVNGDGYPDIVVGAPRSRQNGRAYVYFGGPAADAVPDLVLKSSYSGEFAPYFGLAVSGAGDVNGDGYDDVVVGSLVGHTDVFFGGPLADSTSDLVLQGACGDNAFVAGVGDVNGDGYDDVLVGCYEYDTYKGRARLFLGGATPDAIADWEIFGGDPVFPGFGLGYSVSGAGDINDDGFADMIVGAYGGGPDLHGAAYLFFGSATPDASPDLTLEGEAYADFFGISVSDAGDVDDDGYPDVLVGARDAAGGLGRAYLFHGGPGMDTIPDLVLTGETAGDQFSLVASGAGDADGDGFPDLIVGAPYRHDGLGAVYLYRGGPGADPIADVDVTGGVTQGYWGFAVSAVGDFNDDGMDDVVAGAPGFGGIGYALVFDVQSPTNDVRPRPGSASAFQLLGATPNPAFDDLQVSFSLPDREPATLELWDIAGRRVASEAVGSLGPGRHLVRMGDREIVRPGLYWIRLRRGDVVLSRRAAVLR